MKLSLENKKNYNFYLGCFLASFLWTLLYLLLSWIPYDTAYTLCNYNMHVYLYAISVISSILLGSLIVLLIGTYVYLFLKRNDELSNTFSNICIHYSTFCLWWFGIVTVYANAAYTIWGIEILVNNTCRNKSNHIDDTIITFVVLSGLSAVFGIVLAILYHIEKFDLSNNSTVKDIADTIENQLDPNFQSSTTAEI